MTIRKTAVYFSIAFLLFALSACSSSVSQQSPETTPSYRLSETTIERSVGKLRRLVILPVRYDAIVGSFNKSIAALFLHYTPEEYENDIKKVLLSETISQLNDWKGYNASSFDVYRAMVQEKFRISSEQLQKNLVTLADWVKKLSTEAEPPEEITNLVSEIGLVLNVDGIVIIQGFEKPANLTGVLTLLTATLAWPLTLLEADNKLRADIYEVSSGRIVWSQATEIYEDDKYTLGNIEYGFTNPQHGIRSSKRAVHRLFKPLENAIPKVLVEEKQ